jgi:hypothetical protein
MTTELHLGRKTCCSCKEEKALEAFSRLHSGLYGRQPVCRPCAAKYRAAHIARYPARAKARAREGTRVFRTTPKGVLSSALDGAKKRGLVFELTLEHITHFLWKKPCQYCGDEALGIDRVDNTVGYTVANSVPCCKTCNLMKYRYTVEGFLAKCRQITEHLK